MGPNVSSLPAGRADARQVEDAYRRVRLSAGLATASQQAARNEIGQLAKQVAGRQLQRFKPSVASNQDCCSDRQSIEVLLVLKVLICGYEEIKARRRQPKQFTVLCA